MSTMPVLNLRVPSENLFELPSLLMKETEGRGRVFSTPASHPGLWFQY